MCFFGALSLLSSIIFFSLCFFFTVIGMGIDGTIDFLFSGGFSSMIISALKFVF